MDVHQFTQKTGKIYCGSGMGKFHYSFAGQWFKGNKQVHYATRAILVILPFQTSGFCWDASFLNQLPVCFIQTDYWAQRVVRTPIYIQNILHSRYKFRPRFGDAPFFLLPRLNFVFSVCPSLLCPKCSLLPPDVSAHLRSAATSTVSIPLALPSRQWL